MSDDEAAPTPGPVEIEPLFHPRCSRPGCGKDATHTIVLHFWPVDRPPVARHPYNSVRMFPGLTSCEEHARELAAVGERTLDKVVGHAAQLFEKLSLSPPDLKDCLIDVRTVAEAMKMWAEPPAHSGLVIH